MDAKELRVKLDEISQRLRFIEIKLELSRYSGPTMSHSLLNIDELSWKTIDARITSRMPDEQALQEGEDEVD
jgi:hypothetical protein